MRQTREYTLSVSRSISKLFQISVFLKVAIMVQDSGFLLTYSSESDVSYALSHHLLTSFSFFPTEDPSE